MLSNNLGLQCEPPGCRQSNATLILIEQFLRNENEDKIYIPGEYETWKEDKLLPYVLI